MNAFISASKRVLPTLGILFQIMLRCQAADGRTNPWQSVTLWSNAVLSARLHFLPAASLADENILFFEFDNRSGGTLNVAQVFVNLDGERKDPVTGQTLLTGGITSGRLDLSQLAPGLTTTTGFVCLAASANLGLPPHRGYLVDASSRCDARLSDGRVFATPPAGVRFNLEWRYPSPTEIEAAKPRLRTLLANPEYKFDHGFRLQALLEIREVADSLTVDELLQAVKPRQNSVDGRFLLIEEIARRFTTDPKVVAWFHDRLSAGDNAALWDLTNPRLWNSAWTGPLVAHFVKGGDDTTLRILGTHRADWVTNRQYVSTLSAALLRHRPLLNREVASLATNELFAWSANALEAGVVGDKALARILTPALEDQRIIHHPQEEFSAYKPMKERICDAALVALLTILDGSPAPAFKEAGEGRGQWAGDDKTRFTAYDRVIASTKRRLRELEENGATNRSNE